MKLIGRRNEAVLRRFLMKPGVGSFVRDTTDRCELLVDRICRQPTRSEVHAVTGNHDPVEGKAWF